MPPPPHPTPPHFSIGSPWCFAVSCRLVLAVLSASPSPFLPFFSYLFSSPLCIPLLRCPWYYSPPPPFLVQQYCLSFSPPYQGFLFFTYFSPSHLHPVGLCFHLFFPRTSRNTAPSIDAMWGRRRPLNRYQVCSSGPAPRIFSLHSMVLYQSHLFTYFPSHLNTSFFLLLSIFSLPYTTVFFPLALLFP